MRHKIRIRGPERGIGVPKWVGLRLTKRPDPKCFKTQKKWGLYLVNVM